MRLSSNNLVAVYGFLLMSLIATCFTFTSKFVAPLSLLANIETTDAALGDEYTEKRSTRKGISTTSYEIQYEFMVDGEKISGKDVTGMTPQPTMTVQYDKRNPSINGTELSSHAYFDISIFVIPFFVLVLCTVVLVIHYRSNADAAATPNKRVHRGRLRRPGDS